MSVRDMLMAAAGVDTGGGSDTNFKNVTLLLNGDGTNGAQNNTFLDSSSNAFSITRNGNTTQGSFSPYGSLWSNFVKPDSNYLTLPTTSSLSTTSNTAWTFECWVYPLTLSSGGITLFTIGTGGSAYYAKCSIETSGEINFASGSGSWGVTQGVTTSGAGITTNKWVHIEVVRSSGNLYIFKDGTLISTTSSFNFGSGNSGTFSIGTYFSAYGGGTDQSYISNFRFVTSALNTTSFTPSTTPLTAVSGTQLLTCQSNRFIDNSANAYTISVGGSPSVQRFSPFNPTAPYSTATIGGSGYFDGSGDYLSTTLTGQAIGTSSFTCECFFYETETNNMDRHLFEVGDADNNTTFGVRVNANGTINIQRGDGTDVFTSSATALVKCWNHLAVVRNGSSSVTVYLNGVSIGTLTLNYNYNNASFFSGGNRYGNDTWKGYITDTRCTKSAVYTSSFTPPTAPLTTSTSPTLLLNYTNAGIPDSAMMNDLETVGNAQVSTSVKKFGTGSIYLDGTGDNLKTPYSSLFNFGTGDFTVECWANISYVQYSAILSSMSNGITSAMWLLGFSNTDHQMTFGMDSGGNAICGADYTAYENTWTHIAACRSGSTLKLFFNGTQVQSVTNTTNFTGDTSNPVSVGTRYTNEANYYMNGYIDDLRITKGYARYTANFTPPTAALPTK